MIFSQIKVVAVSVVIVAIIGAAWYFTGLRADLAQEQANNKILQASIQEQKITIEKLQKDFADIREANKLLSQELERQRQEKQDLLNKFNVTASGDARDFGALAAKRPEAIQRLVNRGTKNAMRCLELASGAPHTQEELDATLTSQINPECPTLANPNYKAPLR